ncbi:hypothetical protein ASE92_03830 [Pedobacter sp. Leaf41]|jgi:hypothetical protein|uniref:hypothetical protein n=1 Tax=Pedobacter sp. Leaf41 TaxID=1736218 RepID=UPI00070256DD|nr:hypothetical protein [Pedobacter sp. Leaf41]KQN38568.1 hypothetical protein ASE92_03830 [Pedobacter sp. Leaf41]RZL27634.1 MAG: hypothetical protein EOO96_22235 [Pedobacter sp.]
MNISPDMVIKVPLKGIAKKLSPKIFKHENNFCVLYGEDAQTGIYGCGISVEDALIDWEHQLNKALSNDVNIKRLIANVNPPENVQHFLETYRSNAKKDNSAYNPKRNF